VNGTGSGSCLIMSILIGSVEPSNCTSSGLVSYLFSRMLSVVGKVGFNGEPPERSPRGFRETEVESTIFFATFAFLRSQ
jgi:hypothetical protein